MRPLRIALALLFVAPYCIACLAWDTVSGITRELWSQP